jgi:hypothetical protein
VVIAGNVRGRVVIVARVSAPYSIFLFLQLFAGPNQYMSKVDRAPPAVKPLLSPSLSVEAEKS